MAGDYKAAFGAALKRTREAHGSKLTQEKLAEAVDVAPETISRLERGELDPSVPTLLKIADALGADLDHLFGRRGKPRSRPVGTGPRAAKLTRLLEHAGAVDDRALKLLIEFAAYCATKR